MASQRRIRLDGKHYRNMLDEIKKKESINSDSDALKFLLDMYPKYQNLIFTSRLTPK